LTDLIAVSGRAREPRQHKCLPRAKLFIRPSIDAACCRRAGGGGTTCCADEAWPGRPRCPEARTPACAL